jgi:hypothetical protein
MAVSGDGKGSFISRNGMEEVFEGIVQCLD